MGNAAIILHLLKVTYTVGKILHDFFCNNFAKTFYSEIIIGTYSIINVEQNNIEIIDLS